MTALPHRIARALDALSEESEAYEAACEVENETGTFDVKAAENHTDAQLAFAEEAVTLLDEARPILGALEWVFTAWDAHTLSDIGPALTCGEADAMIDLLRAAGRAGQADSLLEGHAAGDDEGDEHWQGAAS